MGGLGRAHLTAALILQDRTSEEALMRPGAERDLGGRWRVLLLYRRDSTLQRGLGPPPIRFGHHDARGSKAIRTDGDRVKIMWALELQSLNRPLFFFRNTFGKLYR